MPSFVKVATAAELPPGSKKLAEVDGRPIAVFNVDGIVLRDRRRVHPRRRPAGRRRAARLRDHVPAPRGAVRRPDGQSALHARDRAGGRACRPKLRGDDVYVALSDE